MGSAIIGLAAAVVGVTGTLVASCRNVSWLVFSHKSTSGNSGPWKSSGTVSSRWQS